MQISIEGHDSPVDARAGETILAALLRAGIPFAFSCQGGTCGTCKCQLLAGRVRELVYSAQALAPVERARGLILACRALPEGNVAVRRVD